MAKDKDYNKLIHSARWVRLRASVIAAHPLCAQCEREGYVSAATEVHHLQPVENGLTFADKTRLMFDPLNLVPLCHRCHVEAHKALGRSGGANGRQRTQSKVQQAIERFLRPKVDPRGPFSKEGDTLP